MNRHRPCLRKPVRFAARYEPALLVPRNATGVFYTQLVQEPYGHVICIID